jgi:hypothetical protein
MVMAMQGIGQATAFAAEHRILGTVVGSTAPVFVSVLVVHVAIALIALFSGLTAAVSVKGSPRHVRSGRLFYRALIAVFGTALVLAGLRLREDWYLAVIGAVALGLAYVGVRHRRRKLSGDTGHIVGMGFALAAMLTAFYVDNGPHLPGWDRLPVFAFWILPGLIATPLIIRAVRRYRAP